MNSEKDEYWCVVANVKKEISFGPGGKETRSGLRKFKAGAKVNVVGSYDGVCMDIIAIGQHRNTGKYISCVIRANSIENFRVKRIYSPQILEFVSDFRPNGALISLSKKGS